MLRTTVSGTALVALCAASFAQQQVQPCKVLAPLRDAGIYHVDTGSWTRHGHGANFGPDVIYSSTASVGYFGTGWEGATGVDEGTLPGTGHPAGGPHDGGYVIDGFQFGYCCQDSSVDWSFFFLPSYVPCDLPYTPANCSDTGPSVDVPAAPGGSACWLVTIDLGLSPHCVSVDGGVCAPGYQGGALGLDHFGLAHRWSTPTGAATGPLLGGYDPSWGTPGSGTCYNSAIGCSAGNTALGAHDLFALEGGSVSPGCYWFGGYVNTNGCSGPIQNPGAQFWMELYADCSSVCWPPPPSCGAEYCATNPMNSASISIDSCTLDGAGNVVTVTNTGNTLFAYLCIAAGNGVFTDPPGSSGDLCLVGGGPIGRYNADLQSPQGSGTYKTDLYNGNTGGGTGDLPFPPGGTLATGETWYLQGWHRMPAGALTEWSHAMECVFF